MRKDRQVPIGHVMIGDTAVAAVADAVVGDQLLLVYIELGAIGGCLGPLAPELGKPKARVGIDQVAQGSVEFGGRDVAAVDEGEYMRVDGTAEVTGGLRRSVVAAEGEGR
jgi:hypothetical protein